MAKLSILSTPLYNLQLSSEERDWLKAMTQSYMGENLSDETTEEYNLREGIWKALAEELDHG